MRVSSRARRCATGLAQGRHNQRKVRILNNPPNKVLFNSDLWRPTLEKYAQATHLTLKLFDADLRLVFGPIHSTPLFQLFEEMGYDPAIISDCAQRCLIQTKDRPPVLVCHVHGLAVIGTSLM